MARSFDVFLSTYIILFEVAYNPDGTIDRLGGTRYYYNYAGQMTCVMSDCGLGANYEYDNNGALIKTECDNGLTTAYTYDSRGRLESLKAGFGGAAALLDARYTYDGNGNRTGREELFFLEKGSMPTRAVTQYGYDSMNRLTMEKRNGLATTYTYDMAGNRTARVKGDDREQYRYNSRNQLTELTGMGRRTSYQYDPAGNLTQEQRFIQERAETRRYAYDAYSRNTEVRGEDFLHKNFYDAEGLRNRIEENGKATDFVYSGDMLYSEKDESGATERHYILGNEYLGHVAAEQDETSVNDNQKTVYSYIADEQGSLRYILNAGRQTQTYQEYSAFGERIWQEGASSRLGYNSQMGDELTGLTYLRARYYNPATGRFTQEDVIYDDGFNLYTYCSSNPVIYCDPSGFAKLEQCNKKLGYGSDSFGNYTFKDGIDIDLRGQGTYEDALDMAFEKTGLPKDKFNVTKWGKDKNGKSFPVEWRASNGAEVSIDLGHSPTGNAPTVPHVGWQTGGKRGSGGAARGHIFVDDVPYNR